MKTLAGILLVGWLAGCAERPPQVTGHAGDAYPQRLSTWGVVTAAHGKLRLGARVVPYDLATPLFSDHAHKLRTLWLPEGTKARYAPDDVFEFPVGTIISKTFYYPRSEDTTLVAIDDNSGDFSGDGLDLSRVRLIETRLLVRQADGWDALPYVWDPDQNDAHLELAGDIKRLTVDLPTGVEQSLTYVVPTRNECASCHASNHTSGLLHPIGPAARHLNKDYAHYANGSARQLDHWVELGLLDRTDPAAPANALWQAGATDDLERRARSYLDINCGHCHNPHGAADTSGLMLNRAETEPRRLGECKPPVAAGRGSGGRSYSIVPGAPQASIVAFRMASTDPGEMMPELGRSLAHTDGVALVSAWIASLPGDCG